MVLVCLSSYGLKIDGCSTLQDFINTVRVDIGRRQQAKISSYHLQRVVGRLEDISKEDCPICLESMNEARVLQPCLHFTCMFKMCDKDR